MNLEDYRAQIDEIDGELIRLFARRMETAADIAAYKKENGLGVLDASRERKKLEGVAAALPEGLREYGVSLFSLLFELSRSSQNRIMGKGSELTRQIEQAIQNTPPLFPPSAMVACQGWRGPTPSWPVTSCLRCPACFIFPTLRQFFPP